MNPTTPNLRQAWADLQSADGTHTDDWRLQLVVAEPLHMFAAVAGPTGRNALLLSLPATTESPMAPIIANAFTARVTRASGLPEGSVALLIELCDASYDDLFETMAQDILESARQASDPMGARLAAIGCLRRWERFVARKRAPLSADEVRGLIGELVVLCRCAQRVGAHAALDAWAGPAGGIKDFELANWSLEVKTCSGDEAATITISSPEQLDMVPGRPLYLVAVQLTPTDSGHTLGGFVAMAQSALRSEAGAELRLEDKLSDVGFMLAHADLYPSRYAAGPIRAYAVQQTFPRLRLSDLPLGVVDVKYAISLSAISNYLVETVSCVGQPAPGMEQE